MCTSDDAKYKINNKNKLKHKKKPKIYLRAA